MKKTAACFMAFVIVILSVCIQSESLAASVASVPSSFKIARGQSSVNTVTYQFAGSPSVNTTLNSPAGNFMTGGETIESNPVALSISVRNGTGSASETIAVPVRVIERALKKGLTTFTYVRNFSSGAGMFSATISFSITTGAGVDFDIQRIGLYFESQRPETTVEQDVPNLRAFADIRFVGSGLMQGYWEVDGRILSRVNQHLTFTGSATLQTPDIPALPTSDPGSHMVRFVVTSPQVGIPMPSILYFVIPRNISCSIVTTRLLAPADAAEVGFAPLKFEWERVKDTTFYLIGFYDNPDAKPVFSAYTKDVSYLLPERALKSIFTPGKKYYWKVTGFDSKKNIICQNKAQSFIFKK